MNDKNQSKTESFPRYDKSWFDVAKITIYVKNVITSPVTVSYALKRTCTVRESLRNVVGRKLFLDEKQQQKRFMHWLWFCQMLLWVLCHILLHQIFFFHSKGNKENICIKWRNFLKLSFCLSTNNDGIKNMFKLK